jgi:hypothetical protein
MEIIEYRAISQPHHGSDKDANQVANTILSREELAFISKKEKTNKHPQNGDAY